MTEKKSLLEKRLERAYERAAKFRVLEKMKEAREARKSDDVVKQDRKLFDDPELDRIVKEVRHRRIIDKIDYKKL